MKTYRCLLRLILVNAMVCFYLADKAEESTVSDDFTCPKSWISDGAGKCYRLHTVDNTPNIKKVTQAAKTCAEENATLARVRFMKERLLLSELFQQRHPNVDTWYVGGKKKKGQWYGITLVEKALNPRKQGLTVNLTKRRRRLAVVNTELISEEFLNLDNTLSTGCLRSVSLPCGRGKFLTLSNRKSACSRTCDFLGGYYWRAAWSFSRTGLNFVCEKEAKWTPRLPEGVCGHSAGPSPLSRSHSHNVRLKVVGGNSAPYGKHPWQAGIKRVKKEENGGKHSDNAPHCAATIINGFWLLSVAHCYRSDSIEDLRVVVGENLLDKVDAGEEIFEIEEIIPHENFKAGARDSYDISLIKIKPRNGSGIVFDPYVQPACLPTPDMPHIEGQKCWVTGWGSLGGDHYPNELMEAQVPLVNHQVCEDLMTGQTQNRTLCAGDLERISAWKRGCQGDSGGPLVCDYRGAQTVVGITSWGHYCDLFPLLKVYTLDSGGLGILVYPGVFTRVQSFLPWIDETMERSSSSPREVELPRRP